MSSESIIRRLHTADRVWQRNAAAEWLLRSVKWACAAVLVCAGIDLTAQLNSGSRMSLSLVLALAALAGAGSCLWRAFVKRGPLLRIARLLEDRDASLGSSLVNVLQLEEQAADPSRPELTRQLARQAVADASQHLSGRHFLPLLKSPARRRAVLHAVLPLVFLTSLILYSPEVAWREVQRFLDPRGDHPPFSFTRLAIVTPAGDGEGVIYRRSVTIEAEYGGHRPDELFLVVTSAAAPDTETLVPMIATGENRFVQQIDSVTADLEVRAVTRDRRSVSKARRIPVILTPQLEKMGLKITPPAYTRLKPRESELKSGSGTVPAVTALAGSTLTFTLESNRPLGPGTVKFAGAAGTEQSPLIPGTGDRERTAAAQLIAKESGRLTFDMRDAGGLPADSEPAAALTVTHDLPPVIEITEPAQDGFIVDTFEAKVAVRISDDYGVHTTRIHAAKNDQWSDPKVIEAPQDPPQREGLESLPVRPASMGARPGDVLTFFADVTDIRPEPQLSRSRTLKLEVISEAQYNDLLRMETEIADLQEKYASLYDELDQLAREQQALAEAAEKAAKDPAGGSAAGEKLAAQQADLNERLNKLADKMQSAVREQPLYDMEKGLQDVLNREAQRIRDSVAQNRKDAGPGATPQQQAKAGSEQASRLMPGTGDGREEIENALADAQKMQDLVTPLTAFQECYREQQDLASQTGALRAKPELSREDKLALQDMAARQRMVGEALKDITKQLREKADAAEETYPEAADDARRIADAIEEAGLEPMADRASRSMLAGRAPQSHDRAESLRAAMERLMPECKNCQPGMGSEFASRLSLARSMLAGNTFQQMAMSRKPGFGTGATGAGSGGTGGFMATGQTGNRRQQSLLGGESRLGRRDRQESATASSGTAAGTPSPGAPEAAGDPAAASAAITRSNRPADAAATDAAAAEYSDLVDAYFRKLTTPVP